MAWNPPSDAVEAQPSVTSSKEWTPPSDAVVSSKPFEAKPTESTVAKYGKSFLGGTASLLDFPLSAPGFVASTAAELATTTGGMLASPFTGETPKQAYQRGAKAGEVVGEYLMNPMQRLMGMFGEVDAYSNAPLPTLMGWFSNKLQAGGEKLEKATGIPSEAVPLMANVGMSVVGTKGTLSAQEALKQKALEQPFRPAEKTTTTTTKTDTKPPPGATPQEQAAFKAKVKAEKAKRDSTSPLVETALRNKETGNIERMGPKHDEARKESLGLNKLSDEKINKLMEPWKDLPQDQQDIIKEYIKVSHETSAQEKFSRPEDWTPEESAAWNEGWEEFSKARGYSKEQIETFRKYRELSKKVKDIVGEDDAMGMTHALNQLHGNYTHEAGFLDKRGNFLTRQEAADRAVSTGQVATEEYTTKEMFQPSQTVETINAKLDSLRQRLSDAERSDDYNISRQTREEIKQLEQKLKIVEQYGPTEPKYKDVTKTRAKLERPDEGLHSGDLRAAGDERFAITEDQPAGVPKKVGEPPVDRTKTSPRDVKDQEEFLSIATDIYEKHGDDRALEFFKGWEEFKATWAEPVKEVENFVGTNLANKAADARIIHNNTVELKELAGESVNLDQLSFDIDSGKPLEGQAKTVADKFRQLMDELGKRALENNVIKGWHEDYVARNIVTEGAAPPTAVQEFIRDVFGYGEKASGSGTKTTTKYGEPRKLKTREDLVTHINGINEWLADNGYDYRFKLKTNNLADIYKDYAFSVEKAIENKKLIENIKQIRNVNGENLIKQITKEDPLPFGWKQIDHPDLAGYAIHPDLVAPLKFVFDAGPGMTMQALGTVSQAVKRVNVIGSFFHAKSLMEVLGSANIPMWTPFKEAIVLPLVEKGVKGVTGKNLQLSAISKAVEQFRKGGLGDSVDTWVRQDGLQLEIPEDVSKGILSSTGKLVDSLIGKYGPKTRILEKSLSTVEKYTLGVFDKYTWDYLHTGGKIMVAEAYLEKARLQAAKEGKPFDEVASRKQIAQFVNDSFGGLNWFEAARNTQNEFAKRMAMAAYSPEGRRALQVTLFAPDWTISTLRAFTSALPKNLNPTKWQPVEGIKGMMSPTTKADYARLYQFKTALLYLTLLNFLNNMTANRDIWDNKDPTRIEWPDGTSMQAMKHAMEPYHWIADPDKTLANKLGFIPKAAIIGLGGVEYASPTAPKLVDLGAASRLKAAAGTALPFQLQAGADAPEGEGPKRALLGTLGFPVYGSTPEQRKQKKRERDKALKEKAAEYHKKAKEKGWEE